MHVNWPTPIGQLETGPSKEEKFWLLGIREELSSWKHWFSFFSIESSNKKKFSGTSGRT